MKVNFLKIISVLILLLIVNIGCKKDQNVTNVTLDKNNITLDIEETATLKATVYPEDAANKAVNWTSSNSAVADVVNGIVTAKEVGETTITVITEDGNFTAECIVTVTPEWPPLGMTGSGTIENPWQINTADHLRTLSLYVNARNGDATIGQYYKLMNDIDLIKFNNWEPIGKGIYYSQDFQGNFNGNGKTIKNLTINSSTGSWIGLFGSIKSAEIENLCLEHCYVNGENMYAVSGLVGESYHSTISNCFVSGEIVGYRAGMLVGQMTGTTVAYCYSSGNVNGRSCGGLVGNSTHYCGSGLIYNKIFNCYSTCVVNGEGQVGGLVGYNEKDCSISNSYATGKVTASGNSVGGLVGSNYGTISYCHAKGTVKGYDHVGGLIGYSDGCIVNCVAANDSVISKVRWKSVNRIAGYSSYCGCAGNYANINMIILNSEGLITIIEPWYTSESGIGKNMSTLRSRDFYTTTDNWCNEAWDMTSVWDIENGKGLPFLRKKANLIGA